VKLAAEVRGSSTPGPTGPKPKPRARGPSPQKALVALSTWPAGTDRGHGGPGLSEFGRIDILINNAAIRPHKPFTELTVEDWEAVRGVVLDGAIYCTRAVIDSMVKNRYGRIVFFTGEGAFGGGSGRAHVSAAKMGLVGLARALASEFAARNIRVNVVSPGSIDTSRENPEWYQGGSRTPPAFPWGVRARSTRSPPPACSWSLTTAGLSPARPSRQRRRGVPLTGPRQARRTLGRSPRRAPIPSEGVRISRRGTVPGRAGREG
jgi:NAD(P)-dependent dehydrogenase (short-subunit alcohol dehydrogenase family)